MSKISKNNHSDGTLLCSFADDHSVSREPFLSSLTVALTHTIMFALQHKTQPNKDSAIEQNNGSASAFLSIFLLSGNLWKPFNAISPKQTCRFRKATREASCASRFCK